jgi:hypothetical protein
MCIIMTFSEAKQEFEIRYYLWAKSEFEEEIEKSFPNFRSFRTGVFLETHQFMQTLNRNEQRTLAHGLLKRFHPEAVRALGERCTREEELLIHKRDNFSLYICSDFDRQIIEKKRAGEKIKYASKPQLVKTMAAKFKAAFGDECLETDRDLSGDPGLEFEMKSCGWLVHTFFWLGRGETLLNYGHSILSIEPMTEHRQPDENKNCLRRLVLGSNISFGSWLGLTSQIQWESLMDEDIEPACEAAIKHCAHFFAVLPKLLQGLEHEKIAKEKQTAS